MRIIYYCLPGLLEHVPQEVSALAERVELHVVFEVSPSAWANNLLDLPYPAQGIGLHDARDFLRANLPTGAASHFSKARSVSLAVYPKLYDPRGMITLGKILLHIRSLRPDVVHFDGESIRSAVLSLFIDIPVVLNVHEPTVPMGSSLPTLALAKRLMISRCKQIIVHSNTCRNALMAKRAIDDDRITAIPLGPLEIYKAWNGKRRVSNSGEKVVLLLGNLSIRKGIDVFVEAIPKIAGSVRNVAFVIAGRPVGRYELPKTCRLQNGSRLELITRRLRCTELAKLLRESTVLVMPYREIMQSGVLLTAIGFAKPFVASNIEGLREQVEIFQSGTLFQAGNPEDLATRVVELLQNLDALASAEARMARLLATDDTWDLFGQKAHEVWERATSE